MVRPPPSLASERAPDPAPGEVATLACRHGTLTFLANDDPVGRSLTEYGEWAEREIAFLLQLVGEGATVLDVGANVGTHTLPLARRVGPRGKVIAFEPQARVCELLAQNVARNGLAAVEIRCEGVAGAAGEMVVPPLDYAAHVNAGGVALVAPTAPEASRGARVRVIAVDELELARCDLVKLDVEGMEAQALLGMRRTLARCAPFVYAECNRIESGWEVMRVARELDLRVLLHRTPAFDPDNFFGKAENTFGEAHETSLLLVPAARALEIEVIARRAGLVRIASLDDLARAMLETPRWGDPRAPDLSPMQAARRLVEATRDADEQVKALGRLEGRLAAAELRLRELAHPIDPDAERYRDRPLARLAADVRSRVRRLRGRPARRGPPDGERLLARSGLFDADFYRARNQDLAGCSDGELLRHYLEHGAREGRDPCALFDSSYYLEKNADARGAGVNPLVHYLTAGAAEGRNPNPLFDTRFYSAHPRVAASGLNPLLHYLRFGAAARLDPSRAFDTLAYLDAHPDAREPGVNPLAHHLARGGDAGASPLPDAGFRRAPRPVPPTAAEWAELEALRGARAPAGAAAVDVIVPVYLGFAETLRCLHAVLSAPCRTPHAVVVLDDASPDAELGAELERLAAKGLFELVRNERNAGFVATCNRGMSLHPDRDVVLLNSDTEVYGDWLDRLRAAALRAPRVGSVTPLSNAATICSYPFFPHESDAALEIDSSEVDRMAAEVNGGEAVPVPTAVGFCMYIRRACLDEVGLFDLERFGRGYGEENDFSLRAAARGWTHLLATDTFVRHSGGVSFGAEKKARTEAALVKIHERFPDYGASVGRFISTDPPREARRRIDLARLARRAAARSVLFVTHNWGGGIQRHVEDLQRRLEAEGVAVFLLRPDPQDERRALLTHREACPTPNVGPFDLEGGEEELVETLRRLRVVHVHVHSLVGFDQPRAAGFVGRVAKGLGVEWDFTVHDYLCICPRINLIDRSGLYCGEPGLGACTRCVKRSGSPFGSPPVRPWVQAYERLLRGARAVYAPGDDVAQRIAAHFPGVAPRVQPHLEAAVEVPATPARPRAPGDPLRVAIIGAIGPHKGFEILRACARDAASRRLPLTFLLVGYSCDDAALLESGKVSIFGPYEDAALPQLLANARCDCAFFPSVWPETWSYTLSGALAAGLPPVAFDLGVPAERIRALGWGTLIPLTADGARVNDALLAACLDPPPAEATARAFGGTCESVVREYYRLPA